MRQPIGQIEHHVILDQIGHHFFEVRSVELKCRFMTAGTRFSATMNQEAARNHLKERLKSFNTKSGDYFATSNAWFSFASHSLVVYFAHLHRLPSNTFKVSIFGFRHFN